MPSVGVPKNSATMAPISASVELILSALKMNGMAAGRLQLDQRLRRARRVGAHQVALDRAGGGEAGERVHQHREEGDHRDHGGLRRPVEAEPHHHDRRDADDRQRRDEIAERQQPAAQEREAVGDDRHQEAGAAADRVAGQHAAHEGLDEILAQHRQRGGEARRGRARRRQQHGRHAEAAHRDLPEVEHEGAEQQRDREVVEPAQRFRAAAGRPAGDGELAASQPRAPATRSRAGVPATPGSASSRA